MCEAQPARTIREARKGLLLQRAQPQEATALAVARKRGYHVFRWQALAREVDVAKSASRWPVVKYRRGRSDLEAERLMARDMWVEVSQSQMERLSRKSHFGGGALRTRRRGGRWIEVSWVVPPKRKRG